MVQKYSAIHMTQLLAYETHCFGISWNLVKPARPSGHDTSAAAAVPCRPSRNARWRTEFQVQVSWYHPSHAGDAHQRNSRDSRSRLSSRPAKLSLRTPARRCSVAKMTNRCLPVSAPRRRAPTSSRSLSGRRARWRRRR